MTEEINKSPVNPDDIQDAKFTVVPEDRSVTSTGEGETDVPVVLETTGTPATSEKATPETPKEPEATPEGEAVTPAAPEVVPTATEEPGAPKTKEGIISRFKNFMKESVFGKTLRGEYVSYEEKTKASKLEKAALIGTKTIEIASRVFGMGIIARWPDRWIKKNCAKKERERINEVMREEQKLKKELGKKDTSEERKAEINKRLAELGLSETEGRYGQIAARINHIEERLKDSKYLSEEKREKLKAKLGEIKDKWAVNQELIEKDMMGEIEKALNQHVGERTKKLDLLADTISLAGTELSAYALRGLGLTGVAMAKRFVKIKETKTEGEKVKFFKEVIVDGVTDTAKKMFGGGEYKDLKGKRKTLAVASEWGKAFVPLSVLSTAVSEISDLGHGAVTQAVPRAMDRIHEMGAEWSQVSNLKEAGSAVINTLNIQETAHRLIDTPQKAYKWLFGKEVASVEVPGGGVQMAEVPTLKAHLQEIGITDSTQQAEIITKFGEHPEIIIQAQEHLAAAGVPSAQIAEIIQGATSVEALQNHAAEIGFSVAHPSIEHAGFHTEVAGGKISVSLELGKEGAPRYLEQVYDRIAVDNMKDLHGITNVEGSRMLNVAANLTKLTEGHDVAGVSAEDFQKYVSFEGGKLTIADYQEFKANILDRLTGHAQEIISPENVASSGAVAHLDNISQSTWEDIAKPEGISTKGIQFDHKMIDAAEGRLFQSTLDHSGLGKIATDIHFTSESSGTFNLLDQQVVVDHGHVVSIGGAKLEHPLDFGNKQAGDKVLIETASRTKIGPLETGAKPQKIDFEVKIGEVAPLETISKEGAHALDDLEKDVTRLINTGNHGKTTLGLTLEQIMDKDGEEMLKETLDADNAKVGRADNIRKEVLKIIQNSEGVNKKQTLAHFLEHHTDEETIRSAVTGFKPEMAPTGMIPDEEVKGADQMTPFEREAAAQAATGAKAAEEVVTGTTETETAETPPPGHEAPPPPEASKPPAEGGVKPPPPPEAPTPEGEEVKTFTTPDGNSAQFFYGDNGEVNRMHASGYYEETPEFLRENVTVEEVREAARRINVQMNILDSMEAQGQGNTPEANFLRQMIQKTIQDTEVQHGDVFKDVSLTPPAEQAHISPGGVVETGVQIKPADIDLGETSLAASLGVEELSVETIKNINDLDSLAKLKEGAEKALESLRTNPDPNISADTLESARRGIEYIIKEVIDKRIAELKG